MGTLRDLQFALQLKIEELRQRDTLIDELELELDTKDELIRRLQDELDRHRATVSLPGPSAASAACSTQLEDRAKRKTVISEPFSLELVNLAMVSQRSCCDKSQALIQAAFLKNDLLKNLDEEEIVAAIACMYPSTINQGCYVIQEGTTGTQAYVLEEGRVEVTKDGERLQTMEPEDVFGELALLYNCTHTFSVSAQTDCRLWVLDCKSYQSVLMQSGLNSLSHTMELLSSVPLLQSLPEDVIMRMCDLMEETHFREGDSITRQGATGDTFYIVSKGQVKVTEKKPGHDEHTALSKHSERHWFGEKALWGEEVHPVSVIAAGPVTCLVIDRQRFKDIVDGSVLARSDEMQRSGDLKLESGEDDRLLSSSTLSDFHILCTLAAEEFGHVDLVKLKRDINCVYAMRVLKKKLILDSGQREHVLREGRILLDTHCPFLVRLHKTFRDPECLYMLTEVCLGGDLFSLLTDKGCLDECSTRFYTACVVEALTFLHCRGVIYRDVKPENVVLDQHGYAKLIGSRCVKQVEVGKRTWTFCGSPGYMAPEIILNRGHSLSADFWSLGVFVFELLSGGLPFSASDTMDVFTATIGGIDQIDFPENISTSASSLIKKLCRSRPPERLGSLRNEAKDIHKHKWFEGFNWEGLCKTTLKAPVFPNVKHPSDSSVCGDYTVDSAELHTNWDDF